MKYVGKCLGCRTIFPIFDFGPPVKKKVKSKKYQICTFHRVLF
jgi:hypothetical protein